MSDGCVAVEVVMGARLGLWVAVLVFGCVNLERPRVNRGARADVGVFSDAERVDGGEETDGGGPEGAVDTGTLDGSGADVTEPRDARASEGDAPEVAADAEVPDVQDAAPRADVEDAGVAPADAGACPTGQTLCGGVCADTDTNLSHCGACGRRCEPANAAPICLSGMCRIMACLDGYHNCDGDVATGCELTSGNLLTHVAHCGRCGVACPAPANATAACRDGACGFTCDTGRANCAGACVDTQTDVGNCGACGTRCTAGVPCARGRCVEQRSCVAAPTPGCGLIEVAGGTFAMGDTVTMFGRPVQPSITVTAFAMDQFEVTLARFRQFWNAAPTPHPAPMGDVRYPSGTGFVMLRWSGTVTEPFTAMSGTWSSAPGGNEGHPLTHVDWHTAQAFCVWDGGRLPTEAEWEFAARGTEGRYYPWGNVPNPDGAHSCWSRFYACPEEDATFTAGRTPTQIWHMAGNVGEWLADNYADYTDATCWNAVSRRNPLCTVETGRRTVRGGSFASTSATTLRAGERLSVMPSFHGEVGFRCARTR